MNGKNPYKNFQAFTMPDGFQGVISDFSVEITDGLRKFESVEPSGGQWSTAGFIPPITDEFLHELDGAAHLLNVQFVERILPAAVISEAVVSRGAQIEARDGYRLSRKQYAELKDEVALDLLPKAFVKRTVVPVILTADFILIFSSSAKRGDDTLSLLTRVFGEVPGYRPQWLKPTQGPIAWLTEKARAFDVHSPFAAGSAATFKGEAKRTIRVKDREIYDDEISGLIESGGYEVHELECEFAPEPGDTRMTFTLTDSLVFKRVVLSGATLASADVEDGIADAHALAWLVTREYREMLRTLIHAMGGLRTQGAPAKPPEQLTEDEL